MKFKEVLKEQLLDSDVKGKHTTIKRRHKQILYKDENLEEIWSDILAYDDVNEEFRIEDPEGDIIFIKLDDVIKSR